MKRFFTLILVSIALMSCEKSIEEIATEINTYDEILGTWQKVSIKKGIDFVDQKDGSYYVFSPNWTFIIYDAQNKSSLSGAFLYNPEKKAINCIYQDRQEVIKVDYFGANDAVFTIFADTTTIIKVKRNGS